MSGCAVLPEPIEHEMLIERAQVKHDILQRPSAPVAQPIALHEAIARAIMHNRERRLQALEAVIAQGQLDLDSFDMLPQFTVSAGMSERNNYAASASTQFVGNNPESLGTSPNYSVSQDKSQYNESTAFSWSVLDFGLSYVRAKQQADRYLIAKERERKVIHNITQDVRNAYYRALTAEKLFTQLQPLAYRANKALEHSRELERYLTQSPLEALSYQRELLDIMRTLQTLNQQYNTARMELAVLMGLPPMTVFELVDTFPGNYSLPSWQMNVETMEQLALLQRPELVESNYIERIAVHEARAAMLGLMPNLNFTAGYYHDSNQYLKFNDWTNLSTQASWNLFNLLKVNQNRQLGDMKELHAREQTLAMAVAVLAQVHLARSQIEDDVYAFMLADNYYGVTKRINDQVKAARLAQTVGEMDEIREDMNLLLASVRRDLAYVDLQSSYGRLMTSIGIDLVDSVPRDRNLYSLSTLVQTRLNIWQSLDFEFSPLLESSSRF